MKAISGETKLIGLLSHGAKFTLSPAMHNHAAQIFQKDLLYVNFDVHPDQVERFLDVFWHIGGQGLNVTMPHKNKVAELVPCDGLESINTLVRTNQGWRGHSTDGEGFLRSLKRSDVDLEDFDLVIILGSGGAAQAVMTAVSKETEYRPVPIIVLRRSKSNDKRMIDAASAGKIQMLTFRKMEPESFESTLRETAGLKRLIVQGTSAPVYGDFLENYVGSLNHLTSQDFLIDLIYDKPSRLYFSAIASNLRCIDGLGMLIEQARLSQFHWWGKAATYDDMKLAIKKSGWQG